MKIKDLAGTNFPELSAQLNGAAADIDVAGLTADSRQVQPGDLFVAVSGSKANGSAYVADALKRGAVAVVTEADSDVDAPSAPVLKLSEPRAFLARAPPLPSTAANRRPWLP